MLGLIVGFLGLMGGSQVDTIPVVDSSRVLTVNRIMIIGNKITKDRIISRELTLKVGDTISVKRLDHELVWDKRKIYNLRLFHTVSVRSIELPNNQIDLLIEVAERWYTFPIPIFELSDRNFSEWWNNYNHDPSRINYGLNLTRYNFRGRYETLQMIAQFGFTQRYELSYRIPYIDKKQKRGLSFNFDYSEPKNLAISTENLTDFSSPHVLQYLKSNQKLKTTKGGSITYFYRKNFFETHSLQVGFRSTKVADTIVNFLNPNYFGQKGRNQLQYATVSYIFNSEHRDVVQYPLRGYQINAYLQKTGLGFEGNANLLEMGLSYARHFAFKKNIFLSNFTGGYWATPASQPYALYAGMGYKRQYVRGFENYVVETPFFLLNKTTLKKRIFYKVWSMGIMPREQLKYFPLSIYLKTFTDWGYAQNYPYYSNYVDPATNTPMPLNTKLTDKLIGGYGFGFDFVMVYDFVIRTEYTFTNQNHRGFFLSLRKEF
ncbi:MAG: POTRA domain-containing protein [Cyclobacteriaceae bacterium]